MNSMSLNETIKRKQTMKTSLLIRRAQDFLASRHSAAVLAAFLFAAPLHAEPQSGHTDWGSWSFDWEVKDGAALGIRNVYYKHIKPFLGGAGLQCAAGHVHHAYWRVDFDVNGAASDQVWVRDQPEGGWNQYTTEVNAAKNAAMSRIWYVRDDPTGHGVWVFPGLNDGVKGTFSNLDVGPRLYKFPEEGVPWPGKYPDDVGELDYNIPAENIAEQDIVLWYVSHLRHHAADRGCKWHVTGPTFKVQWPGEIR